MIKFSIIIPIFNVENYLVRCLDSVVNQTYKNYECILICDDSSDNSNKIANKYVKKYKFKNYNYKNTGLSEARNIGVDVSTGDYLMFLDADDYFEIDLLEQLTKVIKNQDLIRYQIREIFNNKSVDWNEESCTGSGIDCFNKIINFHYVENAWAYCYNAKFYKNNKFKFMKNCIAEDFGLLPLVIAKASKICVMSYIGYNYVQRKNSLMSDTTYVKKLNKMEDLLKQYKFLNNELNKIENTKLFIRFVNNSLIFFSTTLKYKDYKKYNNILKELNIYDNLPNSTFKKKIKKLLIKVNSYIYYNYISRFL